MNRFQLVFILTVGCCCLLLSKLLAADDAVAPLMMNKQFSADQTMTAANGTSVTSKVFSDNGKIRTETDQGGVKVAVIIRPDLQKIYSVVIDKKMIMEIPYDPSMAKLQSMMVGAPEGKFKVVGPDMVNGVACVKYMTAFPEDKISFLWIDAGRKIPVKLIIGDNSLTISWKNYKAGPQDASLFNPPANYQVTKVPATQGGASGGAGQ